MSESNTCRVACSLPNGLRIAFADGSEVVLKGSNSRLPPPLVVLQEGRRSYTSPAALPTGDVLPGITEGVNRAAFEAWARAHAELGFVKNGLVRILETDADAEKMRGSHFRSLDPNSTPPGISRAT